MNYDLGAEYFNGASGGPNFFISSVDLLRCILAKGDRVPHLYKWLGTRRHRDADKKLTKMYCTVRHRHESAHQNDIVRVEPKNGEAWQFFPSPSPTFKFVPAPLAPGTL